MLKRKIICLFLLLVFTIPVLPVFQVGVLLGSNVLTEEIAHGANDGVAKLSEKEIHSFIFSVSKIEAGFQAENKWERDERFVSRQADDIQTPPPNM